MPTESHIRELAQRALSNVLPDDFEGPIPEKRTMRTTIKHELGIVLGTYYVPEGDPLLTQTRARFLAATDQATRLNILTEAITSAIEKYADRAATGRVKGLGQRANSALVKQTETELEMAPNAIVKKAAATSALSGAKRIYVRKEKARAGIDESEPFKTNLRAADCPEADEAFAAYMAELDAKIAADSSNQRDRAR